MSREIAKIVNLISFTIIKNEDITRGQTAECINAVHLQRFSKF